MNHCTMPPVCEFGEYGCGAEWCDLKAALEMHGWYTLDRMGNRPELDMVNVRPCYGGPPAHQFGEECAAIIPFIQCHGRDDWMGNRPEVDTVNVNQCGAEHWVQCDSMVHC